MENEETYPVLGSFSGLRTDDFHQVEDPPIVLDIQILRGQIW